MVHKTVPSQGATLAGSNRNRRRRLLVLAAAALTPAVSRADLTGSTLQLSYLYSEKNTPYVNPSYPLETFTVENNTQEVTNWTPYAINFNVSGSNVLVTFSPLTPNNFTFGSADFNGWGLADIGSTRPSITGVSINSAGTNIAGLVSSDLSFDANDIFLNWQGLTISPATTISLNFTSGSANGSGGRWLNASNTGNDWSTAANWSNSAQPSASDDAIFNLSSSGYLVNVTTPAVANNMLVNSDNLTLNASAGSTLTLSSSLQIASSNSSAASVTLNGPGTVTAQAISFGAGSGSLGVLKINGCTLNTSTIAGYNGSFNVASGSLTTGIISIGTIAGSTATANFTGGNINVTTAVGNHTLYVGQAGNGVVNQSGTATVTAAIVNISSGVYNLRGGTLITGSLTTNNKPASFNWSGGTLDITATGSTFGGTLVVPGTGLLKLDGALSDPVTVSPGGVFDLDASPGSGILIRTINTLTLSPNTGNGANAQVLVLPAANHSNRQLVVASALSIAGNTNAWQGQFDLANNDLDIQHGSLATITNQIQQGYNSGSWNSTGGMISTTAAADTTSLTALGVIQNNQSGNAVFVAGHQFDGTTPAAGDILVKYTYYGDADLSGRVDGGDYTRIDNGYLNGLTGWLNGDFNYDGSVDGSDYALIDNAFNTEGATLSSELASPTSQIAASTSVPEPASMLTMLAGTIALLSRRKCRRICFAQDAF